MADDPNKAELTAQLALARRQFSQSLGKIREDLDVPRHLKQNFSKNRTAWLGSATALGWILSRLPAKRGRSETKEPDGKKTGEIKKSRLLPSVAKILFSAARPALTAYATRKIASFASRR